MDTLLGLGLGFIAFLALVVIVIVFVDACRGQSLVPELGEFITLGAILVGGFSCLRANRLLGHPLEQLQTSDFIASGVTILVVSAVAVFSIRRRLRSTQSEERS